MLNPTAPAEETVERTPKTLSALVWVENHIKNVIPAPDNFTPLSQFLAAMASTSLLVCHESDLPVVRRFNFWRMILVPHNENGPGPLPRPDNSTCYPAAYALPSARVIAKQHPGKGVLVLDSPLLEKNFVGETSLAYQVVYDDGDNVPRAKRAPLDASIWFDRGSRIVSPSGRVQIQEWTLL